VLLAQAQALGAELVATGHYARLGRDAEGSVFLRRGADASKDQSYFLHGVDAACLQRTVFPLGDLHKPAVRAIASAAGLPVASKSDSQEICFLPTGDRREFLRRHGQARPGAVVDLHGRTLARHDGIGLFTVGQRRGLQVAVGNPLYVHHIESESHTVVVGDAASLWSRGADLDTFWQRGAAAADDLAVQLRYRSVPAALAGWEPTPAGAQLRFAVPQRAVAPGQAAVLYDGDIVVGGGRIRAVCA
jgi:tRNA-specific 2-thiouridylase